MRKGSKHTEEAKRKIRETCKKASELYKDKSREGQRIGKAKNKWIRHPEGLESWD